MKIPSFFEIKYEDIMADEASIFRQLFMHYKFSPSAIDECLNIADSLSFKNYKKREEKSKKKSHLRSGRTGEWRSLFGDPQKSLCKDLLGDALVKLGYETNHDW